MDLTTMTKDELLDVATRLAAGEYLRDIEKSFISQKLRDAADHLHNLLCDESHLEGVGCTFYLEKSYTDPGRMQWVERAKVIMEECSADEDELYSGINRTFTAIRDLNGALSGRRAIDAVIYHLLISFLGKNIIQKEDL